MHCFRLSLLKKPLLVLLSFSIFALGFPFSALAATDDGKNSAAVLCYHHIVPDEEAAGTKSEATISVSEFEEQMRYLYDHGYYTASLTDIENFLYFNKQLPERTVLITFDDGYESNYTYAYPILRKYGLHAVIFLIGGAIETPSSGTASIPKLSLDEIKEMSESGFIEFGSHTFNAHYLLDKKSAFVEMSLDEITKDFEDMKGFFDKAGAPKVLSIAYPYGQYDEKIVTSAVVEGYKLGFTVTSGFIYQDSSPMTLNRIIVPPGIGLDKFKTLINDTSEALPEYYNGSIVLCIDSVTAYLGKQPVPLDAAPTYADGKLVAPLNFFKDVLKWDILWDNNTNKVARRITTREDVWFLLPTYLSKGQVMVPVRELAEKMGHQVIWHQNDKTVEIK